MSADLEQAYAKLAEKADKAKIPSFSGVLARARQRRRRAVSTSFSALVVLAVFAGVAFLPRHGTTPEPQPGNKVFVSFDAMVPPVFAYPGPAQFAMTMSDE